MATRTSSQPPGLGADFWRFFVGQTVSNLGSAVTLFALPLLVYRLTGSALNLGIVTAVEMLPYLLFGLVIGAWVDRVDRRRLMIATDIGRALVLAVIPVLAVVDRLSVWAVYVVAALSSTLTIAFDAAQFAAIPSLVGADDLVTANGRIQASFSTAQVAGPPLAGAMLSMVSVEVVFLIDALSFLVSAASLSLIATRLNGESASDVAARASIRRDVVEGLRYVLGHPILRNISMMMALVNFVGATVTAQLVLYARDRLDASEQQVGLLFSAGSAGVIALSLAAGPLRRRFPFGVVALGALALDGVLTVVLAWTRSYPLALLLWALIIGLGTLFNINTGSLRQAIVPNHLLGRVISVAGVLAWSAIPLGALLGGWAIERTGNVALIYAIEGVLMTLIALAFFGLTPLGRAERYLPVSTTGARVGATAPASD